MSREISNWSKRRWTLTVLFVAGVQLALIWTLSDRTQPASATPGAETAVRLMDPVTDPLAEWLAIDDPMLFALVNPKGFSGTAWLQLARFPYQPSRVSEPPRLLAAGPDQFARDLDRLYQADQTTEVLAMSKPRPALSEVPIAHQTRQVQPVLRVEGELARRAVVFSPPLPAADPDKASACVIKVAVNAAGDVISHVLWTSSGSAATDQLAMAFARNTRFSAVDGDPATVSFGDLVFHWFAATLEANSSPNEVRE